MSPIYVAKLGLNIWKTSNKAQKIDCLILKTYNIVLAKFLLQNSLKRV